MGSSSKSQAQMTAEAEQKRAEISAARKGQKMAQHAAKTSGATNTVEVKRTTSEELLHALYRKTKDVVADVARAKADAVKANAEKLKTNAPVVELNANQIIYKSREWMSACRMHGLLDSIERVQQAAPDFNVPVPFLGVVYSDGNVKTFPPAEAVEEGKKARESGTLKDVALPFWLHYVMVEWSDADKKSLRMTYYSGEGIDRIYFGAQASAQRTRNMNPDYGFELEAYTNRYMANLRLSTTKEQMEGKESWFPIEIEVTLHGHPDFGKYKVIEWEEIPNGVPFRVVRTRVKKG